MDLFDAYGSRIAPRVDYEQQEEHSDPAQNQATNNPDRPPKRALSNDCPVGTQNDQNKPYKEKQYRLQQWELAVQVLLCFFTALAFGAAAIYAYIAKRQLDTMNATLKEAHVQNVAQQRALLGVDGDTIPLRSGHVGLRIKNQGRMTARIVLCRMKYEQFRSNKDSLVRRKDEQIDALVAPEQPITLSLTPPVIPRLAKGEWIYVRLDIYIAYDDGFGTIQNISPCLSYNVAEDTWEQSCMTTYGIDLSKRLSGGIWLPHTTKK